MTPDRFRVPSGVRKHSSFKLIMIINLKLAGKLKITNSKSELIVESLHGVIQFFDIQRHCMYIVLVNSKYVNG